MTPNQFESRIAGADQSLLLELCEMASRQIDDMCGRHFYVESAARVFTPWQERECTIDDLLAITSLEQDLNGDFDYTRAWAGTDYLLDPANTFPKMAIRTAPNGSYCFSPCQRSIKVTGKFGFGDGKGRAEPWNTVSGYTITLDDASTTTATTSADDVVYPGQTLLVENEQIYVSAVEGATLTVIRGVNGTTAAAHSAAAFATADYPRMVQLAALNLAVDYYNHRGGADLVRERWADYEYERQRLSEYATFRDDQLKRFIGPYMRLTV